MERQVEAGVVLRRWRMPVRMAILSATVWPLCATILLLYPLSLLGRLLRVDETMIVGFAFCGLYLCGLVFAVRALLARVVIGREGLRVHNVESTVRIVWSEVEAVEEISLVNWLSMIRALWYGTAIRVRGRRRSVRILASWSTYEPDAVAFPSGSAPLIPGRAGRPGYSSKPTADPLGFIVNGPRATAEALGGCRMQGPNYTTNTFEAWE